MKLHTALLSLFALALSSFALGVVGKAQASFPGQNGQIAFERGSDATNTYIYVINPDGTGERLVAQGMEPDWSPGGRKIAFVRHPQNSDFGDIYTINPNGTGITRLTYDGRWKDPAWSPAGTQIAATYSRFQPGSGQPTTHDIRIINVADRLVIRFAESTWDHELEPSWSPDGAKIAFSYETAGFAGIVVWQLNADGDEGKLRVVSVPNVAAKPDWSPDGQYLAYHTDGIRLVKSDGSEPPRPLMKRNNAFTAAASWSPDGTKITFHRSAGGVYVASSSGGGETRLTEGKNPDWGASCPPVSVCIPKG